MTKMTNRIESTRTETPTRLATRIVAEDAFSWTVLCEGCGKVKMNVAKREYHPVDPRNPQGKVNVINYTAASARRCITCGPFPVNE